MSTGLSGQMNAQPIPYFSFKIFHSGLFLGLLVLFYPFFEVFGQTESVIYTSGSGTFTVPHRVSSLQIQAWGGGASGGVHTNATGTNSDSRGGGGGGAYVSHTFTGSNLTGLPLSWSVGTGGTIFPTAPITIEPGANGGTTSFNFNGTGLVTVGGGVASKDGIGPGGTWASPFALNVARNGGNGSARVNKDGAGGGGSGANAASSIGQTGGSGDGEGGDGGNTSGLGQNGSAPGGGGGGKGGSNTGDQTKSGNGVPGRIQISWLCSIALTSSASSTNQTLCLGTGIGNITYVISGATGATVSGLPPGVSANYVNGDLTISGVPGSFGIFNYTVTPTGYCTSYTASGTITVNGSPTITSPPVAGQSICASGAFSPISVTVSGTGLSYQWYSNTNSVNSGGTLIPGATGPSFTPPVTAFGVTRYYYSVVSGSCSTSVTSPVSGPFVVNDEKSVGPTSSSPSLCIQSPLSSPITHTVRNASGIGTATGLPSGISVTFDPINETLSLSGTPTQAGIFNYSIPILGCGPNQSATGTITVLSNSVSIETPTNQAICLTGALIPITYTTSGATGISSPGISGAHGLPQGVSATWSANKLTISGTPTQLGVFNFSIPLTGGCGTVSATGTITVNSPILLPNSELLGQTKCLNQPFEPLSVATGQGWTYQWYSNSSASTSGGTPIVGATSNTFTPSSTQAGTIYYYVAVNSAGCGAPIFALSGAHVVLPANIAGSPAFSAPICINTPIGPIEISTSGATGIGTASGLPPGITATWGTNTITLYGTPTSSGTFNYSIPLTGGCGSVNATGTITVTPNLAVSAPSMANPSICFTTALPTITHTTFGATGIGLPIGLPPGVSASWSSNTITISGTPTSGGTFNYSIPVIAVCGSEAATGTITVSPGYSFTSISSTRPSTTGNTSTVTVSGSSLTTGTYLVTYNLSTPIQATGITATLTVVSTGTGTFTTVPIENAGLTTLTITSIKKSTDTCTIPVQANHETSFSLQYLQFDSNSTFTIPEGVTCVRVELWGGGGAGGESDGSEGGGGGGGGAYLQRYGYAVSPGSIYTITIGSGGATDGANGGATTFASGVGLTVNGGFGGSKNAGGAGGSIIGSSSFIYDEAGGNGGMPTRSKDSGAAGGGQAGGTSGFGANGFTNIETVGGAGGGMAGHPRSGGVGGTYRSGSGGNGQAPGGGGGGAGGDRGKNVGFGAPGRVIIHFDEPCVIQTCSRIIDDGVVSGNVIIEFFEDCVWNAPEGLIEFEVLAIGGGGAGMVHAKVDIGSLPGLIMD